MDPVTHLHRRRTWPWWLAAAAWLSVSACLSLPRARRAEPSFPHRVHVVDNDLACTFCHPGVRTDDRPGMPPPELCAPCHDQFDRDKPPERRIAAFFDERSRYRTVADTTRPADVRFSHRQHTTEAKLDCSACHGDVAQQDSVPLAPLVQKSACMDCHATLGRGNACDECHTEIDAAWQPPSHAHAWLRTHGEVVRCGSERSADRCELCHQDATGCRSCHAQTPPANHDQTFRTRTHGLLASVDRSGCVVCHTQDSCRQCHETTRPRSHRGGFGAPQDRHCVGCHLPLEADGCGVCHDGTPSHDLAAPLPAGHVPSMNCRMCHGNGVALPHPDGGHVCTACHR
ncbi:MAG: cytochrome c3 family protein [Planctomycetes bacterium]|nr:cytochrome c3 family protein [Planctomycetota bacterium]